MKNYVAVYKYTKVDSFANAFKLFDSRLTSAETVNATIYNDSCTGNKPLLNLADVPLDAISQFFGNCYIFNFTFNTYGKNTTGTPSVSSCRPNLLISVNKPRDTDYEKWEEYTFSGAVLSHVKSFE